MNMKKLILFLSTGMFGVLVVFAQTPYDNFAPEQCVKSMIELPQTQFRVANTNTEGEVRYAEFDKNTLSLNLLDENDNVIKTLMFDSNEKKFLTMDPLAEKYYSISPYTFCLNNPIRFIDPFGNDVWEINSQGEIINRIKDKTQDAFYMVAKDADGNYQRTFTTDAEGNKSYNSISFKYGTVKSQKSISFSSDGKTTNFYDVYQVRGDANGSALFEFMSKNVTGSSSEVEFSHLKTGVAGDKGLNFLTTSYEASKESGAKYLINGQLNQGYFIREFNHSHPRSAYPSGLNTRGNDIDIVTTITDISKYWQYTPPSFNIYHVPSRTMIPYTPSSQPHNFGLR